MRRNERVQKPGVIRSERFADAWKPPRSDTHEHLIEEDRRLTGGHPRIQANDWSLLFSDYLKSELIACGMSEDAHKAFFSPDVDPIEKWKLLAPHWPSIRHTGYGQAVGIALLRVYGIEELSDRTVGKVQEAYTKTARPGFYRRLLQDLGNIESCQVNSLERPFCESRQPTLLMQDISFLGMHMGPTFDAYATAAGMKVTDLQDWHRVIDWWFTTYGPFAVAVKSQAPIQGIWTTQTFLQNKSRRFSGRS